MKNAKGRMATRVRLRLNPFMMSGTRGPKIFVRKEMTKKVNITMPTI
jgi:hypothetical protein